LSFIKPFEIDENQFVMLSFLLSSSIMEKERAIDDYIWHDEYLTGIHKIDVQHKALFHTANKLYGLLLNHGKLDRIDKLFSDLVRQTKVHFRTEEEMMQNHHYPDYKNQKQLHDLLIQQVEDIQNSQQTLGSLHFEQPWIERLEITDFLSGWLINHIANEDKKLGAFLQASTIHESP